MSRLYCRRASDTPASAFWRAGCYTGHTAAYKLQRLTPSPSCSIETVPPDIAWPDIDTDLKGNTVKRLTLTLIAGALLAASLGGCIVVPAGGYYGGGYHHGYYYR